jgi:hypothetical protein
MFHLFYSSVRFDDRNFWCASFYSISLLSLFFFPPVSMSHPFVFFLLLTQPAARPAGFHAPASDADEVGTPGFTDNNCARAVYKLYVPGIGMVYS